MRKTTSKSKQPDIKIGCLVLMMMLTGCSDFVTVPAPENGLSRPSVFEDDATAISALTGVYLKLANSQSFAGGGSSSLTVLEGVYADELSCYAPSAATIYPFYINTVLPANGRISSLWGDSYNIIYSCNAIIEGLNVSVSISESTKKQIYGEALFIRSFCHFYLTNLFGDIPYIATTDYKSNAKVSRLPVPTVSMRIIEDLLEAKKILSDIYPSGERVRPNKAVATALLARVYLYSEDWINAEIQASELINNTAQYALTDVKDVFLKNSLESIWQIIPSTNYTEEGGVFILLGPPNTVALRNELFNAFEDNDLRKNNWIGSYTSSSGITTWYYPLKYKEKINATGKEYSMVLRFAEQYLIRAEARAHQEKLTGGDGADSDINIIRERAGLSNTTAKTKEELLNAIEQERKVELFTEWGHRFFDLKRWRKLDTVLGAVKPNWNATDALLPIPQSEILSNSKLTQNTGY